MFRSVLHVGAAESTDHVLYLSACAVKRPDGVRAHNEPQSRA
jgi:hypothetical protein